MRDDGWLDRLQLMVGEKNIKKLQKSKVAVFGIGGVGSWAAEALARSGIGYLVIIDADDVQMSNINRQIMATTRTVGKSKVEVMKDRIAEIAPACNVIAKKIFYSGEDFAEIGVADVCCIIDAIDSVSSKTVLLKRAYEADITVFSSMGAGNKCQPEKMRVADISETHTCPLARIIRRELSKDGIKSGIKTVFSTEKPRELNKDVKKNTARSNVNEKEYLIRSKCIGSLMTVTATAGLLLAQCVLDNLIFTREV